MACDVSFISERILKVTGSHVLFKSGIISETTIDML